MLVLVVVLTLGASAAQAEIWITARIGGGGRSCQPIVRYATPRNYYRSTPIRGGYYSAEGYDRRDEIRREQQQLSAENNVIRARQNAERAYARWQDLKRCNSWRDQIAYNNWRRDVLSAELSFINADRTYRDTLSRYQYGGW
ncbi:MAG: hypothetical protein Q7R94_00275 [bacterium]|nr:hypothetical protein [bacterium]